MDGRNQRSDETAEVLQRLNQRTAENRSEHQSRCLREEEAGEVRRSLSPGRLHRKYDWNTTHFYPDINELGAISASIFASPIWISSRSNERSAHPCTRGQILVENKVGREGKEEKIDEEECCDEESEEYESAEDFNEWSKEESDFERKEILKRKVSSDARDKTDNPDKREISPDEQISPSDYTAVKYRRTPDILLSNVSMLNGAREPVVTASSHEKKNTIRHSRKDEQHMGQKEVATKDSFQKSSSKSTGQSKKKEKSTDCDSALIPLL